MKRSIFYSERLGDFVVDEMCQCGHLKSEHGSLLHKIKGTLIREANDGGCCSGHCECRQFRFARYVAVEERASMQKKRRRVIA